METGLSIGKVLKRVLEDVLPKKVFPLIAPANTPYPFIIYRRSSISINHNKDHDCANSVRAEVVIASTNYEESIAIAENVRKKIEHGHGKIGDLKIHNVLLVTADESFLSDAYIQKI